VYLTEEEERGLRGDYGEAMRLAYKVVVKVGEALGAPRLIKIVNAHISGISYKNIGDAGLDLLQSLADMGARFSVPTTINPAAIDLEKWVHLNIPRVFAEKQKKIVEALVKMGAVPLLSCMPYFYSKIEYGDQIAWAESNAVLYANSIIGARTNREGGPLSLFEAIIGRAPYVGLRTPEGRQPTIRVRVGEKAYKLVLKEYGFPLLGYVLGKIVKKGVPQTDFTVPLDEVRGFLAAIGASSSLGMVIMKDISPEWREVEVQEKVAIQEEDLRETFEELTTLKEEAEIYYFGCPHLTLREVEKLLEVLEKKPGKKVVLSTSRWVLKEINRKIPENVTILADMCLVVAPLREMGYNKIITDSAKAAHYLSAMGIEVKYVPRNIILGD